MSIDPIPCPLCDGEGGWWMGYEGYEVEKNCEACNGTGEIDHE